MLIYKAINKQNDKVYIGQTIKTIQKRKKSHYREVAYKLKNNIKMSLFHNALNKYNENDFEWVDFDSAKTKTELNNKEKFWIEICDTRNIKYGYNISAGGDGGCGSGVNHPMYGKKISEAVRKKIGQRFYPKGKDHPFYGKKLSKETKLKIGNRYYPKGKDHPSYGRKQWYLLTH